MRTTLTIALLVFVIFSFNCSKDSSTNGDDILAIEDLLVENNELTGWTYSGTSWIANNISELTVYINGAAVLYESHGFVEGAHQTYQGLIDDGTREISVTVYNQGTESNASNLFDDPETGLSGATDWADGAGERAHYVRYGGLSQILTFYSQSYFVYISINYDTDESLNILKQFALNIDGKIQ